MNIEDDEYYKDVKKVFQETPLIVDDSIDNQNEINHINIRQKRKNDDVYDTIKKIELDEKVLVLAERLEKKDVPRHYMKVPQRIFHFFIENKYL